jgi:chemotaxis protein methyltransferase CheR
MDESEFRLLQGLIRDHAGILFSEENAFLLERRLQGRLQALHLRRFIDYYDHLRNPALPAAQREQEMDELCERIVTRETYFFREDYQLDLLRDEILPQLRRLRPRGERLSLWSAGCSTGEEPYTLAMEVLQSGLFHLWDVQITGTDLSREALEVARAGAYGPSSFRQVDGRGATHARYFRPFGAQRLVAEEVRRLTSFARLNLHAPSWSVPGEPFDVIFCRNVLIYLDRALRPAIVRRFSEKLVPGGYLLLGHSENLLDMASPLSACHIKKEIVYRKPAA